MLFQLLSTYLPFLLDEDGAEMSEVAIVLALVVVVAVAGFTVLGGIINTTVNTCCR